MESTQAGKADACDGCPNQSVCAEGPKGPDPDIPLIQDRMSGVKRKVLVLSGKGGVGKSTFSAGLSWALAADDECQVSLQSQEVIEADDRLESWMSIFADLLYHYSWVLMGLRSTHPLQVGHQPTPKTIYPSCRLDSSFPHHPTQSSGEVQRRTD